MGQAHAAQRPYHHGQLRAELLDRAHDVLRADGPDALSLRDLGRRAGVSTSAPFRHFPTRADLLDALAMDGYRVLTDVVRAALRSTSDFDGQLHALTRGYVTFGRRNPALLRLMMGRRKSTWDGGPLGDLAASTFGLLEAAVRRGQTAGEVRAGDASDLTVAVWAQLHGLATLIADGMLEPAAGDDPARPTGRAVVPTAVEVLIAGLRPQPDPGAR